MLPAKLKFSDREVELAKPITTVGRTSDNDIPLADDTNISRSHAEIEFADGDFYLSDLASSNGTAVNGVRVDGRVKLAPGDKIVFGNSTTAEFALGGEAAPPEESSPDANAASDLNVPGSDAARSELSGLGSDAEYAADAEIREAITGGIEDAFSGTAGEGAAGSAAAAAAPSGTNPVVLVAGAVCGLAVIAAVVAGGIIYTRGSSSCAATAKITAPETGDTITKPTDVEFDISNGGCVAKAVIVVDDKEVASADAPATSAKIDPKDFPEMADGDIHDLKVVLVDDKGARIDPTGGVLLAFDTRSAPREPTPGPAGPAATPGPQPQGQQRVTLLQIQQMSQDLVKKFSGGFAYDLSNKQFMQEIQKRTGEYAVAGYSQRAVPFRDPINVAFTREQNIDAPLGWIIAMSRSKFDPAKKGDAVGLWQLSDAFVTQNNYNGACGTETLADPAQNCAAKSAALYTKALLFGVFDSDPIYTAAAFGKTPAEAAIWKATLPANRADLWNSIKTAPEREQLIRFFAAGIVSENPQKFGLANDHPLSELYRVTM